MARKDDGGAIVPPLYRLSERIGAGGMGEVYRAHDTTLGRDVAVKVLSPDLAADPDRSARLEREARLLATLNHSCVATIHGFEVIDGRPALILELVEGPTLAERIARGKLSINESCEIAARIASALEAAHDKAIIHRDLKPANIKFTAQDHVKVLDFGLAKLIANDPRAQSDSHSTMLATSEPLAMIVGTPAYMSPEQARGEPLDRTTDIWSLGCVLFEMLSGVRAFDGSTVTDVLGAVLQSEPPWHALPSDLPVAIRLLLRRCLQKDRRRRLQYAADARIELEHILTDPTSSSPVAPVNTRSHTGWIAATTSIVAAIALALLAYPRGAAAPRQVRFDIPTPDRAGPPLRISPDGSTVAYQALAPDGRPAIFLRPLDSLTARIVAGTEGSGAFAWSPDGRFLAFVAAPEQGFAKTKLKKIEIATGATQVLAEDAAPRQSVTWGRSGLIVFPAGSGKNVLRKVSASGGEAVDVTTLETNERQHMWPSFLPDGRHFLYLSWPVGSDAAALFAGSTEPGEPRVRLMDSASMALYAAPGYLLNAANGALLARPFDARALRVTGDAFTVVDQVNATPPGRIGVDVSDDGTLIYRRPPDASVVAAGYPLQVKDAGAAVVSSVCADLPGVKTAWRVSPDARHLVMLGGGPSLSVCDLRSQQSLRLDGNDFVKQGAVWSPDGTQLAYGSMRGNDSGGLFAKTANGATDEREIVAVTPGASLTASDWSSDGQTILFSRDQKDNHDLWTVSVKDHAAAPYLTSRYDENQGVFSPDGKFVAYSSNELSRDYDVVVQPFPNPSAGKWKVSLHGGCCPRWTRDGRALYYVDNSRRVTRVNVRTSPGFSIASVVPTDIVLSPSRVNSGVNALARYDVTPDGLRFVLDDGPPPAPGEPGEVGRAITVLLNWNTGVKR